MGIFVNYPSNPFANITNVPTTILIADTNPLQINGLIVCNRVGQPIRFNLKKIRTQTSPVEIFYVNELPIGPYETVDVVAKIGLQIFLEYSTTPNPLISDSLICFTNGYTQICDCEISYTRLNDLPLA
tara:strand:- start:583 stop:966 length:384 start_codon:yes stop_codon:yes gene_type:complete